MTPDFVDLVKRMRLMQKEYFKTRDYSALKLSKELEKQVDHELSVLTGEKLL